MDEKDPTIRYEDVRRAGLNPAADYGGAAQMAEANEAIARAKAEAAQNRTDEPEQLDLFSTFTEDAAAATAAEEPIVTRAVLGSRAMQGALPTIGSEGFKMPSEQVSNPEGRSKGALEAQRRADQAYLRQMGRGRGPGR